MRGYLAIFIIISYANGFAQSNNPEKRIDFNYSSANLENILADIEIKTGIKFIYGNSYINGLKISFVKKNESIKNFLSFLREKFNLSYKMHQGKVVLFYAYKEEKKDKRLSPVVVQKNVPIVYTVEEIQKPILITKNKLEYPSEAYRQRLEGDVTVKFLINKTGDVANAFVSSSSGYSVLDSASVEHVRQLKYYPAQSKKQARTAWMSIRFEYRLIDE